MIQPLTTTQSFESIEQMDDVPGELGWPMQYRQLEPGAFSSKISWLAGDSWFLIEEQSNRAIEVQAGSLSGMIVLALLEGPPVAVNGRSFSNRQIFLQSPECDFRATLPAGIKATQIGVACARFQEILRAVAPDLSVPQASIALYDAAPDGLASARSIMREAVYSPARRKAQREEVVSAILAELLGLAAAGGNAPASCDLHRAQAKRALDRARDYIEAHMSETIRVAAICAYAGTSIRSLERIFAREMRMTPQQYVKIRRLNAVHRRLLAGGADQGLHVSEVAVAHGVSHLGRFSGEYRRFFGEYPRDTLERC